MRRIRREGIEDTSRCDKTVSIKGFLLFNLTIVAKFVHKPVAFPVKY